MEDLGKIDFIYLYIKQYGDILPSLYLHHKQRKQRHKKKRTTSKPLEKGEPVKEHNTDEVRWIMGKCVAGE